MQLIQYKARDGKSIEAILTLPQGTTKANPAPLLVLPHGGPWASDSLEWNPEVQFFASRGFAILQPNYRGSSGYNWKFSSEDLWDFRKMHEDVTDGVRVMIESKLVDPEKICIMGTSFGGYLALCGATLEPDLYRSAIAISGVFDWEDLLREARSEKHVSARFHLLRQGLGSNSNLASNMETLSPINGVDKIKIPIFVGHGREDEVVGIRQSKKLVSELKKHGVDFTVHFQGGEGHGTLDFQNRVELYSSIAAFLENTVEVPM